MRNTHKCLSIFLGFFSLLYSSISDNILIPPPLLSIETQNKPSNQEISLENIEKQWFQDLLGTFLLFKEIRESKYLFSDDQRSLSFTNIDELLYIYCLEFFDHQTKKELVPPLPLSCFKEEIIFYSLGNLSQPHLIKNNPLPVTHYFALDTLPIENLLISPQKLPPFLHFKSHTEQITDQPDEVELSQPFNYEKPKLTIKTLCSTIYDSITTLVSSPRVSTIISKKNAPSITPIFTYKALLPKAYKIESLEDTTYQPKKNNLHFNIDTKISLNLEYKGPNNLAYLQIKQTPAPSLFNIGGSSYFHHVGFKASIDSIASIPILSSKELAYVWHKFPIKKLAQSQQISVDDKVTNFLFISPIRDNLITYFPLSGKEPILSFTQPSFVMSSIDRGLPYLLSTNVEYFYDLIESTSFSSLFYTQNKELSISEEKINNLSSTDYSLSLALSAQISNLDYLDNFKLPSNLTLYKTTHYLHPSHDLSKRRSHEFLFYPHLDCGIALNQFPKHSLMLTPNTQIDERDNDIKIDLALISVDEARKISLLSLAPENFDSLLYRFSASWDGELLIFLPFTMKGREPKVEAKSIIVEDKSPDLIPYNTYTSSTYSHHNTPLPFLLNHPYTLFQGPQSSTDLFFDHTHSPKFCNPTLSYITLTHLYHLKTDQSHIVNKNFRTTNALLQEIPTLEELKTSQLTDQFITETKIIPDMLSNQYIFAIKLSPLDPLIFTPIKQNIYFLIDSSAQVDKQHFTLFKKAVLRSIKYLDKNSHFNIVFFDKNIDNLSTNNLRPTKASYLLSKRFLKTKETRTFTFSSQEPFSILNEIKRRAKDDDEMHTIILLSDGHFMKDLYKDRQALLTLNKNRSENFAIYTASMGENANHKMLGILSKTNKGGSLIQKNALSFERKFTQMIRKIKTPIAHNLHLTTDKNHPATILFDGKHSRNLFASMPLILYGTTTDLSPLDLMIQGKVGNQWINIKKEIAFEHALKGSPQFQKSLAKQQALEHYLNFIYFGKQEDIIMAQKLLDQSKIN